MTYMPRPQAPQVSRIQAERNNRWWQWKREHDRILGEAIDLFKAGDVQGALALQEQAAALSEPDIFNG